MKTFLIFLTALALTLAGAHLTSGHLPDAALVFAGAVSAGLIIWTLLQYQRKFPPLTRAKILRPALPDVSVRDKSLAPRRKAA